MSKKHKFLFVVSITVLMVVFGSFYKQKLIHEKINSFNGDENPRSSSDSRRANQLNHNKLQNLVDPLKAIKDFEDLFNAIKSTTQNTWIFDLKKLSVIVNGLSHQNDFRSLSAAGLMMSEISDLMVLRLMKGEVSPEDTLLALASFDYKIPNDQQIIDFICEYYPEGETARKNQPPESVSEFVSRFETDPIFPADNDDPNKINIGIITERKAMASLLVIGGAKLRLQAAQITAVYLQSGGDPKLKGTALETDMTLRVGKNIAKLPIPFLGEEKPTAATFSFLIENALNTHR